MNVNVRAAGAIAGVVLEAHLQRLAKNHQVAPATKEPTISQLNDTLRDHVYDQPTWRRIQYLGDLRNLCAHKKQADPTESQVRDLIVGVEWVIKSVI